MAQLSALTERSLRDEETGCLRWQGACSPSGYGYIHYEGKTRRVHRVAYEAWIGPIPEGHEVDHVYKAGCRHRDCIEPSHLEAVTKAENVRRVRDGISHCPKGHEYTEENTMIRKNGWSGSRVCRTCKADQNRAYREKVRTRG